MKTFSRYWHTLRHLKPVQFYGRLWFRFHRPKPDFSPAPPLRELDDGWQIPARRAPSLLGPGHFVFLNREGRLDDIGWTGTPCATYSKLWRYNQHYFDDLNAEDAESRRDWQRELMRRWVAENPPGQGDGWEPYPTSLRIVNWVKWALAGNELPSECLASLAVQVRWLLGRLEIHLLGNHLFANAKALVFAGSFFAGEEAERWLRKGLDILGREVPEQILADGGHFERSTMYHALALEDMLDLYNLLCCMGQGEVSENTTVNPRRLNARNTRLKAFLDEWPPLMGGIVAWLQGLSHPDGEIGFFNDAALGVAPPCSSLLTYARRLGITEQAIAGPAWFAESGYIRLCNDAAVLLFDAAPVGPDYLPGHAHADTLSFELSLFGQRVFVNSGTSQYGLGSERLRQRGTAAHNTVVVNGENSSEVWSGFRVARRAYPSIAEVALEGAEQSIAASHDGYRRLSPSVAVSRSVRLRADSLLIEDALQGGFASAEACFHLHPAVRVSQSPTAGIELCLPGGERLHMAFDGAAEVSITESTWHPRFGVVEPNQCIVVVFAGNCLITRIEWT